MIRRPLSAAALLMVIALSREASAGDAALAESLFQQGLDLMEKGDYVAACPKLEESFAQEEATGTLLALALCKEQSGQTASAWAKYTEVMSRAKRDGRPDRERAALEKIQALEPRLSRLAIEVDPSTQAVPGLVVKRDGLSIGKGAWGVSSPVDPGEHIVEVTAPRKRPWRTSVTIGATADLQTLNVPPLEDEPSQPTAIIAPPPSPPKPAKPADTGTASKGISLQTLGLVTGGAGIVSLGVSAYFGVHSKSLYEQSNEDGHCDANDECDSTGLALRNSAVREADAATVTLIAGGVLTAAGVTLFIVGRPKAAEPSAVKVEVTPAVGPGVAAMHVRGRF